MKASDNSRALSLNEVASNIRYPELVADEFYFCVIKKHAREQVFPIVA
jgi:hypothetical protein